MVEGPSSSKYAVGKQMADSKEHMCHLHISDTYRNKKENHAAEGKATGVSQISWNIDSQLALCLNMWISLQYF